MKTALALILLMMTTTGCALPLRLLRTLTATPNPDTTPYPKTILRGLVPGERIDWIGCSRDWRVAAGGIDRTERDGRTPSDHAAVTAVLE